MKLNNLAVLIIVSVVILLFGKVLLTNLTFVYRDFGRYFYPLYQYGVLCLKQGIIPFWNPHIYSGMPFFALIQLVLLYPLSIIFYLFPFMFSLKLFIVSHYFLSGLFVYILMREWKTDESPALISSITYTFSGYLLSCIDLTNTLISAIWIPLIFFFYSRTITRGSFLFTIFTGFALAIQLLGGDPVVFYLTLIVLFLFTCFHFSFKSLFSYLLSVVISIGLTLFQTLPFFELTFLSQRAEGIGIWEATLWSLSKYELLNLICPFFTDINNFGQQRFFESLSCGILPLFFTLIAVFFIPKNRKLSVFWIMILLCFIVLSFGQTPYKFLYQHFPLFNMIRYPIKFFCMVNFAISILTGLGFSYLLNNPKQKVYFLLLSFSLIIICIFCWIFTCICNNKVLNSPLIGMLLLGIISFLICLNIKRQTFSFAVIGLVIINLIIFGFKLNPVINQNLYTSLPKSAEVIKDKDIFSRFLVNPITEKRYRSIRNKSVIETFKNMQSVLAPNIGMNYLLFDAYGYEAIPIRDYDRFIYYVKNQELSKVLPLISMINVKYIISEEVISSEKIKLIYSIKDEDRIIRIYENEDVLPRAYLVSNVIVVKDRSKVFKVVSSSSFNPKETVVVEEKIKNQKSKIKNQKSKIEIEDYQPNSVRLNVFSSADCILFMSDTYYPGWQAYVDGQETKIYRANYIFRAIEFPAGKHKVEFKYFPTSFKVGVLGTFMTLILLVTSLIIWLS